jgi:hypothetical protein
MSDKRYRIWCETEATEVYVWDNSEPTECPNDAGHTIDSDSITIIEKRKQTTHAYAHLEFNTGALPYVEVSSDSYTTIGAFEYSGKDVFEANKMTAIVSRAGTVGTAKVRLRDVTNGNTIEGKTWTTEDQQVITDASFQNVPSGTAILEVQVKVQAAGDSAARVWNFSLEREE